MASVDVHLVCCIVFVSHIEKVKYNLPGACPHRGIAMPGKSLTLYGRGHGFSAQNEWEEIFISKDLSFKKCGNWPASDKEIIRVAWLCYCGPNLDKVDTQRVAYAPQVHAVYFGRHFAKRSMVGEQDDDVGWNESTEPDRSGFAEVLVRIFEDSWIGGSGRCCQNNIWTSFGQVM